MVTWWWDSESLYTLWFFPVHNDNDENDDDRVQVGAAVQTSVQSVAQSTPAPWHSGTHSTRRHHTSGERNAERNASFVTVHVQTGDDASADADVAESLTLLILLLLLQRHAIAEHEREIQYFLSTVLYSFTMRLPRSTVTILRTFLGRVVVSKCVRPIHSWESGVWGLIPSSDHSREPQAGFWL